LVDGSVTFALIPTDISKVAYQFMVVEVDPTTQQETILNQFDAVVPYSPTAIYLTQLAPQAAIRYDLRDASLLTLARYLSSNDSFISQSLARIWNPLGIWDTATVYKRGDVVKRLGSLYVYKSDTQQAGKPPELHPDLWL
jgi:hypothetical protein